MELAEDCAENREAAEKLRWNNCIAEDLYV